MTRQTVAREIARLDALSRTRALDVGETQQLARLVQTERAYGRMQAAEPRIAPARKTTSPRSPISIVERLDATIARMVRESLSIRAIYLTEADRTALLATVGDCGATGNQPLSYRGYPVRQTSSGTPKSTIYSIHGIARSVYLGGRKSPSSAQPAEAVAP
ncbi:hypothetical protein [Sphingomonas profundi]|uniref:hypothetical protein n=1 Tax=Alterirhizorhabdus profundi TaxID=2681549 RepID=UPI0012E8FB86|nr:hypothetical protein [Sphingomonas profundi]